MSDGQLTGQQGRQLENREVAEQRKVNGERQANHGDGLTPAERQLAERHENRLGREVAQDRQQGTSRDYANSAQARRYGADGRTDSREAYAAQRRSEAQAHGAEQRSEARQQRQAAAQPQRQAQQRQAQPQQRQAQPKQGQGEGHPKGQKGDGQERQ